MTAAARDRLIVALDVPDGARALRLVEALEGEVSLFKVGSQLFTAAGPSFVRELTARGAGVFLDLCSRHSGDSDLTVERMVERSVRRDREVSAQLVSLPYGD